MKKIYLAILWIYATTSSAQITLSTADFPHANDTYVLSNATPFSGMDETLTGGNYTWDYSQLLSNVTGQHTDTILDELNTNLVYQIVFGDFSILPHRSNQAATGPDIPTILPQLTITNVYNFYYNNSNDYHQSGFGAEINGIPLPVAFDPHDIIYRYPVEYGNSDSSQSAYEVDLTGLLYYSVNQVRHNEVDGWGSLTTPYGTFDVLRIKSVIERRDSVYLDSFMIGFGFQLPEQIEYKWLGQGQGAPLLQINTTSGNVTSIEFRDSLRTSGAGELDFSEMSFSIFPNPASDMVIIKFRTIQTSDILFSLTNISGCEVSRLEKNNLAPGEHIQTFLFGHPLPAKGNYLLTMSSGKQSVTKPLLISGD